MCCLRELIYVIKIFKTNLIAWKRHLIPKIWSWHCNSVSYSYSPRNSVALCLQHLPSSVSLAPCDIFPFHSDSVCAILCLWLFQWPGFAIHSNAHLRHASQDLSVQAPFLHLCLGDDVWPFLISVNLVSFPWLCDPISLQQWTLLGSLHLNYKSDTQPSYKYLCLSDNGNSRSYPAFVISQNRKPATHRAYCYTHHLLILTSHVLPWAVIKASHYVDGFAIHSTNFFWMFSVPCIAQEVVYNKPNTAPIPTWNLWSSPVRRVLGGQISKNTWASQVVLVIKNPPASARDRRDTGLTPRSGRSLEKEWQPTPGFLPGESHGQRSLTGYSPWGHKESDTTEVTVWHTY